LADLILQKIPGAYIDLIEAHTKTVIFDWNYTNTELFAYHTDTHLPDPGIPVIPSPIHRDYNFPTIFPSVFDHQKSVSSYLSIRSRAFCFSEMGTGKSASAIWAADYLMNMGVIKRALIVCPISVMDTAWRADVLKTAMHRSVGIAYHKSDKNFRAKVISGDYEFVITNYDGVGVMEKEIADARFDLIIGDEANGWKNASTKRWRTLSRLILPSTRLWLMTGTPASQSPIDAYGLAKLVSPYRVPKFATAWRDRVMQQQSRFRWTARPTAKDAVFSVLQPAIRFTKKECLTLPDVVYQTREVPLTPQVEKYYKLLKQQMLMEVAGEEISAVNAAAKMNKLLQVSGGCVYTDGRNIVEFDVSPRLAVLDEVLEETENKTLIFVPYIHTIEVLVKYLTVKGYSVEVIKGDVNANERARIINAFQQDENPKILVIQPQAAQHGVTLTAASTVVFWSPVMSAETYMQCVGRADRVGQKAKVSVVNLVGSEAEKRIADLVQGKIDSHLSLVDLYKQEIGTV
jgi:SNF2 family DNA or RNA helicase